jgi:hypoxanthine phosphoribosyltransferase
MKLKTWKSFLTRLNEINFGKIDLIVAIGGGGIIPAGFIQQKLKCPMKVIGINYRDEANQPRHSDAVLLESEPWTIKGRRILLVDDVSRTGKTLRRAAKYLQGNTLKTCVVNGASDFSFYNEETCFKMPWKP